ncbi:MAG: M28 family peptidase [Vampirovibrionales bacterium]|nr:M28 family peptidase [Vampirovibrionales bacterium]
MFTTQFSSDINTTGKSNTQTLQQHVEALAKLDRSFENVTGLNQAADYIKRQWIAQGFEVTEQPFKVDGKIYKNLMVSLGPQTKERLIVGAHYDVCAHEPSTSQFETATIMDAIRFHRTKKPIRYKERHDMPGADDNASGVAGLLEMSRLLKAKESTLTKRMDLIAFTTEEPPNFDTDDMGSARHAASIKGESHHVKGMISLDMIGYFRDESNTQKYPIPFLNWIMGNKGNYISVLGDLKAWRLVKTLKNAIKQNTTLPVHWLSLPSFFPGVHLSDHLNYARQGIPSVIVTDTAYFRNPHYHQHTDTPETLDYTRMGKVVDGVLGSLT